MEEKKLYPMRLCSLQDEYAWGSETFCAADLGYRDSLVANGWLEGNTLSEVMDTYMDRVVGDNSYKYFGRQFPVCVRRISCKGRMPLRVHPDDEIAAQRYDFLGKEKLWYVVRAGKDACVMLGFKKDTDAGEFYDCCIGAGPEKLLNVVAAHAGQCFHIAPGTVHCASGEIEIIEVGESSPLDFCLCGWGEDVSEEEFDTSLNLVDALDFINYGAYKSDAPSAARGQQYSDPVRGQQYGDTYRDQQQYTTALGQQNSDPALGQQNTLARGQQYSDTCRATPQTDPTLGQQNNPAGSPEQYTPARGLEHCETALDLPQFCVSVLDLKDAMSVSSEKTDSFVLYHCISGELSVQLDVMGTRADFRVKEGETVLVPAECSEYFLVPIGAGTKLVEATVPPQSDCDSYISAK